MGFAKGGSSIAELAGRENGPNHSGAAYDLIHHDKYLRCWY